MEDNTSVVGINGKNNSNKIKLPYIILIVYFIIYYLFPVSIFKPRPYFLLILPIIGLFYISIIGKLQLKGIAFPVLFLFLIGFLTNLINNNPITDSINELFSIALIYIYLSNLSITNKNLKYILQIIFWTGFVGGPVIGFWQYLTGNYINPFYQGIWGLEMFLLTATQGNANFAAFQLVITLFIGLYLLKQGRSIYRLPVILTALSIIFTISRTTILAVIISLVGYRLLNRKPHVVTKPKLLSYLLISFIVILVFLVFRLELLTILNNFIHNINYIIELKGDENLGRRINQWNAALRMLSGSSVENFFFGFGSDYIATLGNITGFYMSTHNTFMEIFIKYGALGFCLYFIMNYKALSTFLKKYRYIVTKRILFFGFVCSIICQMMVSVIMFESFIFLWIGLELKQSLDD
jgi:O-antigen ligase